MSLKDEITSAVEDIFGDQWTKRDGNVVPDTEDIGLGNDAVLLEGTVLYADLAGSTNMVDRFKPHFAAEVYKAYLYSTAKVIRSEGGEIVAYDGDRVMAVFIGGSKNTAAARCGLKINWTVKNLVTPLMRKRYPKTDFSIRHVVGIDTGDLWVARTGVRGANDLVWVGPAANYAAKLTELNAGYATRITHRVYNNMHESVKYSSKNQKWMWEKVNWNAMNDMTIYRSTWWWSL